MWRRKCRLHKAVLRSTSRYLPAASVMLIALYTPRSLSEFHPSTRVTTVSLAQQFIKHVGPGGMSGCTLREWFSLLKQNQFRVRPRYWPRVALTTYTSSLNSMNVRRERRFEAEVESTEVPPPLIVLGIWRSGTTHLHNLLSKDPRYAWPNTYQALFPNTFLTTEQKTAPSLDKMMAPTRPMDNVELACAQPQEDEFAMIPSGLTFACQFAFTETGDDYWRFMTLRNASAAEVAQWKAKLLWFLKKLTFKHQRPLVLKSPGHTGRIKLLLDMFPNAKFVHIYRNPYDVVRSTIHTGRAVLPHWTFQRITEDQAKSLDRHAELSDAFFEEKSLIPSGSLCEVAFEELDAEPVETMRRIYEDLSLPSFEETESDLRRYVDSLRSYKKNSLSNLPDETKRGIAQRLRRCFEEWGYDA